MKIKACFFLSLFFILSSCGKSPELQFKVYRFVDHLEEKNILRTPFTVLIDQPESLDNFFPLKSFPMEDPGVEDNPYDLKRKIRVGAGERDAIFSPPDSEYVFTLNLSEYSILEFGTGIIRDENSERLIKSKKEEERGVNFLVTLEIKGKKKTIFQKYLAPPQQKEEPTLSYSRHTIQLPYSAKNSQLSFITIGGDQNFSVWFNPVLYNTGKNDQNIILISIDTLRADHLGCYGYKRDTSPNIDSLASDSALFFNTYASSPWTLPSHVSLFTSLYGFNHKVYHDDEKIDSSLFTLTDILRQNHFFCSAFTGGGFVSSVFGFSKGFDTYMEGSGGIFHQDSSERVYKDVSGWLDRNRGKNFFLFIHTYQLHDPYACPYPYKTMFLDEEAKLRHVNLLSYLGGQKAIFKNLPERERQNVIGLYDGEIRYMDEKLIGPLVEKLKKMALYDQTMIIFTSDHGEEFYDHGGWGHGHSLYDESLKVPLIIKFPESQFKNKKFENIISLINVMPTILDEMGLDDSRIKIDGRSLKPVLKGKEKDDRIFFADIVSNVLDSHIPQKTTMNSGKSKLIFNQRFNKEDLAFFLYPPPSLDAVEIYDLSEDPRETVNVSSKHVKLANQIIRDINELFSKAKKRKAGKAAIDEKLKDQLKALGYIR